MNYDQKCVYASLMEKFLHPRHDVLLCCYWLLLTQLLYFSVVTGWCSIKP